MWLTSPPIDGDFSYLLILSVLPWTSPVVCLCTRACGYFQGAFLGEVSQVERMQPFLILRDQAKFWVRLIIIIFFNEGTTPGNVSYKTSEDGPRMKGAPLGNGRAWGRWRAWRDGAEKEKHGKLREEK